MKSDSDIKRDVEEKLRADPELDATDIGVTVTNGVVSLTGFVKSSAEKLEAETAAWLVRANAYTQSAVAELVRVRSIELANSSGQLKFSASHAATLHSAGNQVLQQGVQ